MQTQTMTVAEMRFDRGSGWYRTGAGAAGNLVRNNALRVADDSF